MRLVSPPWRFRVRRSRTRQLDLRRPTLSQGSTRRASRRRSLFRDNEDDASAPSGLLKLGPLSASVTLGVMQMWELGREVPVAPGKRMRRAFDVGFGASYEAATSSVQPCARLRCRVPPWLPFAPDAVIRLLPEPEALLKGSWPVPFTGLRVGVRLALPWTNEHFDAVALGAKIPWKPQFRCRVYSSADRGPVQFSSRGLELAEQSVRIGRDTVLRVAATVDLPREFPLPEDEPPFRLNLDKLAIKSRLRYAPYVV